MQPLILVNFPLDGQLREVTELKRQMEASKYDACKPVLAKLKVRNGADCLLPLRSLPI